MGLFDFFAFNDCQKDIKITVALDHEHPQQTVAMDPYHSIV